MKNFELEHEAWIDYVNFAPFYNQLEGTFEICEKIETIGVDWTNRTVKIRRTVEIGFKNIKGLKGD